MSPGLGSVVANWLVEAACAVVAGIALAGTLWQLSQAVLMGVGKCPDDDEVRGRITKLDATIPLKVEALTDSPWHVAQLTEVPLCAK
jgi:hypothetical protein